MLAIIPALQPGRELIFVQIWQGQALGTDRQVGLCCPAWCCLHPKPLLFPVAGATAAAISAAVVVTTANLRPGPSPASPLAPVAHQTAQDYSDCLLPDMPMDLSPCVRSPQRLARMATQVSHLFRPTLHCSKIQVQKLHVKNFKAAEQSIKPSAALCKCTDYMARKPAPTIRLF